MAERADHDRRRSGSFSKPHARLRTPEEEHVCSRRRRSRVDRRLARGPGDLRERHGDLVTRRIPAAAPALQNHPRVTFGKATRATISSAALRPELLVESRGEGGIAVKATFRQPQEDRSRARARARGESADPLERDGGVAAAEQRVRPLRRSVAGRSTRLIERPLLLDGDARCISSRSICRGCAMHSMCARAKAFACRKSQRRCQPLSCGWPARSTASPVN